MVSFEDWQKIDLRVGKILEVLEIEGKDKLFKLLVSFGEEERSVVAGLKPFYSIDELKGKKAVFVYNLDPVTLAGIKSEAMILAAKTEDGSYKITSIDDSVKEGTRME
jgi:methionine--tRNA ligase beta chain